MAVVRRWISNPSWPAGSDDMPVLMDRRPECRTQNGESTGQPRVAASPANGVGRHERGSPMIVLIRVVAGGLLLAHGLVHLLYLAPDVPEFSIRESWLVPPDARRAAP